MMALADFFTNDYDNSATFVVLAHLSEQNNHPEIARREAEKALATRGGLFQNRVLLASQTEALEPIGCSLAVRWLIVFGLIRYPP